MRRKNIIYPKNFFESEEILDDDMQQTNQNRDFQMYTDSNDRGHLNTEIAETFNHRLITLKNEGDKLLINQDKTFFNSALQKGNKLEINYGGEDLRINHDSSIESGLNSRYYFNKLMILDYALMVFALWQISASVLYYETDFNNYNEHVVNYCLWLILICSAFEIVITYIRYKTQIELEYAQKLISHIDDIYTTKKYQSMILELIVLVVQPYPFLNDYYFSNYDFVELIDFSFKWNWMLVILCMLRIYIIFRVLLKSTSYMSPRAIRVSRMYGSSAGYANAIKCLFQDYPIFLSLVAFLFSIFIFAYSLFICERPLVQVLGNGTQTFLFDYFQNSVWCVIITMTTIGYGDFYPRSLIGRITVTLLVMWGVFIVSVMVVVLNNALSMSNQEGRALLLLKRLQARKSLKTKAAMLLTGVVKYNNIERQARTNGKDLDRNYYILKSLDLRDKTREFREAHKDLKCMNEEDNMAEEMTREFDFVKEDVLSLHEMQEKLCRYIEDNFEIGS